MDELERQKAEEAANLQAVMKMMETPG